MKWMIKILILVLILLNLCACGKVEYNGEPMEFWLVMEQFKEIYPYVSIRLDILPQSEEARTAYLKKIRSEIMSGGGPDLYLVPTKLPIIAS